MQDLEGSLEVVTTQMGNIETTSVDSGLCQDFFEFRMVSSHYHRLYRLRTVYIIYAIMHKVHSLALHSYRHVTHNSCLKQQQIITQ